MGRIINHSPIECKVQDWGAGTTAEFRGIQVSRVARAAIRDSWGDELSRC